MSSLLTTCFSEKAHRGKIIISGYPPTPNRALSRILSLGEKILEVMVGGGRAGIGRSLLGGSGGMPHPEYFFNFEPSESGSETVSRSY